MTFYIIHTVCRSLGECTNATDIVFIEMQTNPPPPPLCYEAGGNLNGYQIYPSRYLIRFVIKVNIMQAFLVQVPNQH